MRNEKDSAIHDAKTRRRAKRSFSHLRVLQISIRPELTDLQRVSGRRLWLLPFFGKFALAASTPASTAAFNPPCLLFCVFDRLPPNFLISEPFPQPSSEPFRLSCAPPLIWRSASFFNPSTRRRASRQGSPLPWPGPPRKIHPPFLRFSATPLLRARAFNSFPDFGSKDRLARPPRMLPTKNPFQNSPPLFTLGLHSKIPPFHIFPAFQTQIMSSPQEDGIFILAS